MAVKVVFGAEFVARKSSSMDLHFLKETTTLAGSAFVPMVPRVTSIAFYNWDNVFQGPNEQPIAYFYGDEEDPLDNITLKEGANTSFSQLTENQIIWDVVPGAGTGIYNDCDTNTGIKTINGIEPDIFNRNFLMTADECYQIFPGQSVAGELVPELASLSFLNTCTPKCTSNDLKAFANYLNRIRDGTASVVLYASNTFDIMKNEIDLYRNTIDLMKRNPRYDVRWIKDQSNSNGKYYFSIAASFVNPTTDPQMLYLSVSTAGRIVRFKYKLGTDTTLLENVNELQVSIPCEKTLYLDLVIGTYTSIPFTFSGAFGSTIINFTDELI